MRTSSNLFGKGKASSYDISNLTLIGLPPPYADLRVLARSTLLHHPGAVCNSF